MPQNPSTCDIVVVGLGAAGSALTLQLARRGVRVAGIDRFHPPHDQGSSHGHSRITRLAVGEGEAFIPLVRRSHTLWRGFEAQTGRALMRTTGLLIVGARAAAATAYHGQAGFFDHTLALARHHGIAHEMLDAAEVRRRHPAFMPAEDDLSYYEPEGGVLFPEACIEVQLELAGRAGARLHFNRPMTGFSAMPQGVTIDTPQGPLHAAQAVWCTGAWLPGQAGGAWRRHLRVLRQVLHWVQPQQPAWFEPGACPAFMWLHGPTAADAFYGFPRVDGRAGVKVATEQFDTPTDPDLVERHVPADEVTALHARHLRGRIDGLSTTSLHHATCLYTMAPDGRFVVDRHPEHEAITLVSPCSGHGFKHSAALGEALAQQLTGEVPVVDLRSFQLAAG